MEQQRKKVHTNTGEATDENGFSVLVEEWTEVTRVKYVDGTFSNWTPGTRRFFVNHTQLRWEGDSEDTLITQAGARYKVTRWGQRTDPLSLV